MRVLVLAMAPNEEGLSFTSAKMAIFQNNDWQPPGAQRVRLPAKRLMAVPDLESRGQSCRSHPSLPTHAPWRHLGAAVVG